MTLPLTAASAAAAAAAIVLGNGHLASTVDIGLLLL
jgi:cobalamin biosynthesis protein CbiD